MSSDATATPAGTGLAGAGLEGIGSGRTLKVDPNVAVMGLVIAKSAKNQLDDIIRWKS